MLVIKKKMHMNFLLLYYELFLFLSNNLFCWTYHHFTDLNMRRRCQYEFYRLCHVIWQQSLSCVITLLPVLSPHQVVREVGAYQTGTNARDFDVGVGSSELPAHPLCQGCYSVLCRRVKMGFSKTMSR